MNEQPPDAFDWRYAWLEHRDDLPHVRQDNVVYFVTFRLNDSLPASRMAELRLRRDQWLERNPPPHTVAQQREYRRLWTARIENLMDAGYGRCVLRDPLCREILERIMQRGDRGHFHLGAYVIMPNHVHALLHVLPGHKVSEIVKAWKSASARAIGRHLGQRGSYWMDEYFDHAVRHEQSLTKFVAYIRRNPRRLPPGSFTVGCGSLSAAGVPTSGSTPSTDADPRGTGDAGVPAADN